MAEISKIPIVAVVGPTASGKTALAVEICRAFNGEAVCADSMQIYKGMDIATAKPTPEEMMGVPHHMVDFLPPGERYSVSDYCRAAGVCIRDIVSRGRLPVLVGGTGLYIDSLLNNIEFAESETDFELREKLSERAEKEGAEALLAELEKIDPETAAQLHPNNIKRIIRALELYYSSGKTMTRQREESRKNPSPYEPCVLFLTAKDRQFLYDRIDRRVDEMLKNGLEAEARAVLAMDIGATAKQAIGCKELAPYFAGEVTLEQAVEKLKRETRRYAKRQLTWFNRNEQAHRLYIDEEDVKARATETVAAFLNGVKT
ncbi:MAG: tRNA (adenosine(37)-N6)-dimethylallyltransferase MiaA [Clostridiales bacterium]|nr:tRNA (adenosine(37)-N6)-dimethylallyltransferase MiaA [Clostridiales bacterium]